MPAHLSPLAAALLLAGTHLGAADLQVMTVGDSITAVFIYQPRLQELLEADGHRVTFVGREGTDGKRHEGYSGRGISTFIEAIPLPAGRVQGITAALDAAWPTAPAGAVPVVLVHIGINDMSHGLGQRNLAGAPLNAEGWPLAARLVERADNGSWLDPLGPVDGLPRSAWLAKRVDAFVDLVLAHPSRPRLVVAKLLPIAKGNSEHQAHNDTCCERIKEWNALWATRIAALSPPDAGRVALVDCYTAGEAKRGYGPVPDVSFWGEASKQAGDWVHPSPVEGGGYSLMASEFRAGITAVLAGE